MAHVGKSCTSIEYPSSLRNVPSEVLSHIFVLCSNPIILPYREIPPQVTVSQVCSRWRQVALTTSVLWSSVSITWPGSEYACVLSLYKIWVGRARKHPLTIQLSCRGECGDIHKVIRDFVVPFRIKMLDIVLPYDAWLNFPPLDVEDFAITVNMSQGNGDLKTLPFMDRIRRISLWEPPSFSTPFEPSFKGLCWSLHGLRSFVCHVHVVTLTTWLDVLRAQSLQSLGDCSLTISGIGSGPLVGVSMPNLRCFSLRLLDVHPDFVIPLIATPSITLLGIYSPRNWSSNTYDIMAKHYKLPQLQHLWLHPGRFPLPVTQVLVDAPMIHSLEVLGSPVLEAEAQEGIASGRLGRCLTSIYLNGCFDSAGEWLDMIETRQRNVNLMVTQVSNWRQMFTGIKSVNILGVLNRREYEERVVALKALGISVSFCGERALWTSLLTPHAILW